MISLNLPSRLHKNVCALYIKGVNKSLVVRGSEKPAKILNGLFKLIVRRIMLILTKLRAEIQIGDNVGIRCLHLYIFTGTSCQVNCEHYFKVSLGASKLTDVIVSSSNREYRHRTARESFIRAHGSVHYRREKEPQRQQQLCDMMDAGTKELLARRHKVYIITSTLESD